MRTTIDIDDRLMAAALKASGKSKRATVEEALRLLVRTRSQGRIRALRGMSRSEGASGETRRDG